MIATRFVTPLLLAAVCFAQEAGTSTGAQVRTLPPIVTMSFSGGTMAQFVRAVYAAEPKANVLVQPAAAAMTVPEMSVKSVGLDQLLECACAVAEGGVVGCMEQRGLGEPVYAIVLRKAGASTVTAGPENTTTVLSLLRLTDPDGGGIAAETILSAIEVGTQLGGREDAPQMRFHQDSGLLFLHGTPGQLALATQVLRMFETDVASYARQAERAAEKKNR